MEMDRRSFLKMAGGGVAFGAIAGCSESLVNRSASKKDKPNIIYIMADDLGYGELGCYGQRKIRTPNIDRLAAEGMKFTQFYSGSAVCAPARCNLMTGMHGGHAYIRNNQEVGGWETFKGQLPLPAGTETIARVLKGQGYSTGGFGKWGLGAPNSTGDPLNLGFDRFFGYNCQRHGHNLYPAYLINDRGKYQLEGNTRGVTGEHYAPQVIADKMLDFVRENRDRPFFLYYPTVIPHLALQVPEEELVQYKGKWSETPYEGSSYLPHPMPKACYAGMISFMDKQVGRLMVLLKELNLDENTIVMFSSDNGTTYLKEQVDYEFFNSVGGLKGLKGSLYEGGIRVPFVARWPGKIKTGITSSHICANYDVMATIAEIVGVKARGDTDGISFLPTLLSKKHEQKQHEYLFWDFAGYGGQIAVRMGRWKGIKRDVRKNADAPLELYDLETDIGEKNNVAEKYPKVAFRIEQIMRRARTKPEWEKFRFGKYADSG
ncbi:MAG: sulfatase-like hydrolase/transferase [Planctomycetota bacterium]|jgi:arylsulfatase